MGLVYLASASGPGGFSKLFVIKELKPELAEDNGFLEMFLEEARLAARLNHPNIVTTYEVGIDGSRPYIVMDYLDGQTLARVLRKKVQGFTLEMHLTVISQALDGLHYAHHQENFDGSTTSIVHRDVSPQNVFITYDGQVKVVDFGIAKASDTTVETRTGVFKGKPAYMAPEQLQGDSSPRGDVYSIGVMLWEAIVGQRMWPKKSDVEVLTSLLKGDIPSIDEAAPDAPPALRAICMKAIARDPDARYVSAKEFRDAIEAYLQTAPRTSLKDVGATVGAGFTEQREKLRGLIERCVSDSRSNPLGSRSKLPSIAPPREDENSLTSNPTKTSQSRSEPSPTSKTQHSVVTGTPAASIVDAPEEPKRSPRFFVALGALGAVALVGVGFLMSRTASLGAKQEPGVSMPNSVGAEPRTETTRTAQAPASAASPNAGLGGRDGNGAGAGPVPTHSTAPAAAEVSSTPATKASPPPFPAHTPQPPPRFVPQPPQAQPKTTPAPAQPPSANTDCNPPFFFEGTKKVFKPGCL
jgi:eukaryotic-like serine/threonine-protein kinase